MGHIKAECGKNRKFELEVEIKGLNAIECLAFVSGVADTILNNVARGSAIAFEGYKGLLIDEIERIEMKDYESNI
jgi:hypothetical protein